MTTQEILLQANKAKSTLALLSTAKKRAALYALADSLETNAAHILAANAEDVKAAKGTIGEVMLDRLSLNEGRIHDMAEGIRQVAELPDPVGRILSTVERPNGLKIEKTAVPMGVIAIIYESRPNVTSDAAALALMAGNACVLRCGKEAWKSCKQIVNAMREGLKKADLPESCISLLDDTTHAGAEELMKSDKYVDLLIPRGGAALIRRCVETATVPVIQTGTGICHIYVDKDADFDMALNIVENAKTSRPSVCNAAESCLIHRDIAKEFLPLLKKRLVNERTASGQIPVELHLDEASSAIIDGIAAKPEDFDTEYLDYKMSVKVVADVNEAIEHIAQHSTHHSEAIITKDETSAKLFCTAVDSSSVYVNASTRFTDGGEFGLGCEVGISTQKLHARGPMGIAELCSYKFIIHGDGQIR